MTIKELPPVVLGVVMHAKDRPAAEHDRPERKDRAVPRLIERPIVLGHAASLFEHVSRVIVRAAASPSTFPLLPCLNPCPPSSLSVPPCLGALCVKRILGEPHDAPPRRIARPPAPPRPAPRPRRRQRAHRRREKGRLDPPLRRQVHRRLDVRQ